MEPVRHRRSAAKPFRSPSPGAESRAHTFYEEANHAVFEPGKVKPGVRGENHRIALELLGPRRIVVHGTRVGNGKLSGEGLIFEIPLQLLEGASIPATFLRVELTATL